MKVYEISYAGNLGYGFCAAIFSKKCIDFIQTDGIALVSVDDSDKDFCEDEFFQELTNVLETNISTVKRFPGEVIRLAEDNFFKINKNGFEKVDIEV